MLSAVNFLFMRFVCRACIFHQLRMTYGRIPQFMDYIGCMRCNFFKKQHVERGTQRASQEQPHISRDNEDAWQRAPISLK